MVVGALLKGDLVPTFKAVSMLRLDALELIGFKSFPRKVRLQFPQSITCLIGPNGCGKSNLADATGWVLGAQTAHSLRGEKMEDVIFGGTDKRKPSSFVQATLAFSRADSSPIVLEESGVSGETLEIGRKLYRSGESIYSINGRHCRLKDIHKVLEEAGLGFASYALIAQGRVGWLLSAKSYERRVVVEEAAGISGYKSRRRSAELKLELAQQNLVRLNDIILEIERQLRSLKRQASKARRYQEIRQQFQHIQRVRFVLEAEQLTAEIGKVDAELEQLKGREQNLGQELAESEEQHRKNLQERDRVEGELSKLHQALSNIRLEVERTDNSISRHQEQIETIRESLRAQRQEQHAIEQSLREVSEELALLQNKSSELEVEEERVSSECESQSEIVSRCEAEIRQAEDQLEELRDRLFRVTTEAATLASDKEQLEQRLKTSQATRGRLEKERANHSAKLADSSDRLKEVLQGLNRKQSQFSRLQEGLTTQEEAKTELERVLRELAEESAEVQAQLIAQRERLQSLHEIEANHSQYSEGVQKLLHHLSSNRKVRPGGTLADFIETSPEYERVVEEFLDEELEYILVDSLEEAVRGVSEVKTIKSGRCTFLTLSSSNGHTVNGGDRPAIQLSPGEGIHGVLSDLVRMKPNIHDAFQRVLPERAQAIVVSDLDRAFELVHSYPESTFITLEGESLTPAGLLSASSAQGRKLGLLSWKREKRELEKRISQLGKKLAVLREKEEKEKQRLQEVLRLLQKSESSRYQLEKEMLGLTHQQERWENEEERQKQALKVVEEELIQLSSERDGQVSKIRDLEQALTRQKGARLATQDVLSETQQLLQQQRSDFGRAQERLHSISSDRRVLQERRLALQQTIKRVNEQRSVLEVRQQKCRETHVALDKKQQETKTLVSDLQANQKQSREQEQQIDRDLQERQREYSSWKARIPEMGERLASLRGNKAELQEKRSLVDVQRARLETQLQNIGQGCWEALQTDLEDAARGIDPNHLDLEESLAEHARLKERIEKFGPINLAALQEYQESEQRYNFLSTQRQDIESSIADTSRAIHEINRRSRKKFEEAFATINQHFVAIFQRLFEGGDCGMRLVDEQDLLESGIDIYAQPPGKRLQNVMLLSGGEKTMAAFAFLMALFSYRPSRFCVLDEVDGPLDDANVVRFTNLVREMSGETQFIIITHNKRTMETAETLYGITMEEPGVSTIVSVDF